MAHRSCSLSAAACFFPRLTPAFFCKFSFTCLAIQTRHGSTAPHNRCPSCRKTLACDVARRDRVASAARLRPHQFSYIFSHSSSCPRQFSVRYMEACFGPRLVVANPGRQLRALRRATTIFRSAFGRSSQRRHFRYTLSNTQLILAKYSAVDRSHFGIMRLGGLLFGRDPPFYS